MGWPAEHFSQLHRPSPEDAVSARYKRTSQTLLADRRSWPITPCVLLSVKPVFGLMGVTSSAGLDRSFSARQHQSYYAAAGVTSRASMSR
jgi:hypothetical protein